MTLCDRCQAEIREGRQYPPEVDADARLIRIGDEERPFLGWVQMELLGVLWARRGSFVSRNTLTRRVWSKPPASDSNLRTQLGGLRKMLQGSPYSIETRQGIGYRLVTCEPAMRQAA